MKQSWNSSKNSCNDEDEIEVLNQRINHLKIEKRKCIWENEEIGEKNIKKNDESFVVFKNKSKIYENTTDFIAIILLLS